MAVRSAISRHWTAPSELSRLGPSVRQKAAMAAIIAFISITCAGRANAQFGTPETPKVHPCRANVLASVDQFQPGEPFHVAVRLKMDPHWHVYWHSPRDGGTPTVVDWKGPPGFEFSPVQWPYPVRYVEEGNYISYVYEPEVLLITEVRPPKSFSGTQPVALHANVYWLVCQGICLEGDADLSIKVKPGPTPTPSAGGVEIDKWRQRVPAKSSKKLGIHLESKWDPSVDSGSWRVQWALPEGRSLDPKSVEFLPFDPPQGRLAEPTVELLRRQNGEAYGAVATFAVKLGGEGFQATWLGASCRFTEIISRAPRVMPPSKKAPSDTAEPASRPEDSRKDDSRKEASEGGKPASTRTVVRAFDIRHDSKPETKRPSKN